MAIFFATRADCLPPRSSTIVVEARGKSCPLPIVLLAKAARTALPGDSIVVRADDRAFPRDLEAWCARMGYRILEVRPATGYVEATLLVP